MAKKKKEDIGRTPNLDSAFGPMQTYHQIQDPKSKPSLNQPWAAPKDTNPYISSADRDGGRGRLQEANPPWTASQNQYQGNGMPFGEDRSWNPSGSGSFQGTGGFGSFGTAGNGMQGEMPPPLNQSNPMGFMPPQKKSPLPIILIITAVILILGIAGGTGIYLLSRDTEEADQTTVAVAEPTTAPKETPTPMPEPAKSRFENAYYYNRMTAEEQAVYEAVYDGLKAHEKKIVFETQISDDMVNAVIDTLIWNDWADFFWVDHYEYLIMNNTQYTVNMISNISSEERDKRQSEIDAACEEILQDVRGLDSTYQKVRRVYEKIADRVDYVYDSPENQNMYSSLVLRQSVCAGYARGFQYLMEKLDIPCIIVDGSGNEGAHSWNIVQIDGQWYQVDVTWSDPLDGDGRCIYDYLCIPDSFMYRDHTPERAEEIPKCTDRSLDYYILNDNYYYTTDEAIEAFKIDFQNGERIWSYQFDSKEAADGFHSFLMNDAGQWMADAGVYDTIWICDITNQYTNYSSMDQA